MFGSWTFPVDIVRPKAISVQFQMMTWNRSWRGSWKILLVSHPSAWNGGACRATEISAIERVSADDTCDACVRDIIAGHASRPAGAEEPPDGY